MAPVIHVNNGITMDNFANEIKKHNIVPEYIFDVGSRDGNDAIHLKSLFNNTPTTFAFEAHPQEFELHKSKNQCIKWINLAIYKHDGVISFFPKGIGSGIHSIRDRGSEFGTGEITVNCLKMSTFLKRNNLPAPDVVKVDVEGCSLEVLQSFEEYLRGVKCFHIESEHEKYFQNQHLQCEVFDFLFKSGFHMTMYSTTDGSNQHDSVWVNSLLTHRFVKPPKVKLLHLTFHYGTANDANYIFKRLGYDVSIFFTTKYNTTNITQSLAEQIWQENEDYFQSFDVILTSDTAGLSYPFLLNIDKLKPKLVVWICNRFNISMENESKFNALFKEAIHHPKVDIIPYTKLEIDYCRRYDIHLKHDVIPSLGRHEEAYIYESHIMDKIFQSLNKTAQFLPDNETFFVPDYANNQRLYSFLKHNKISVVTGGYTDLNQITQYKATIALPDAVCKIFYMEAIQFNIPLLLPSKTFLSNLLQDHSFFFTSKNLFPDIINLCQYYDYDTCYMFFDSFDHLLSMLPNLPIGTCKQNQSNLKNIIHDDILSKWTNVLLH